MSLGNLINPNFKHADLLALLLPDVGYQKTAPNLQVELQAMGLVLDDALLYLQAVLSAVSPLTSHVDFLADWERVYGLPTCVAATEDERRARLKLKESLSPGRMDRQFFIDFAALAGYAIAIDEPTPFILDESPLDSTTLMSDGDEYYWVVSGLPSRLIRVGVSYIPPAPITSCGLGLDEPVLNFFQLDASVLDQDPFQWDQSSTIQAVFLALKPADTDIIFI